MRPLRSRISPRFAGEGIVRDCWRSARAVRSAYLNTCRYTSRASIATDHPSRTQKATVSLFLSVGRQLLADLSATANSVSIYRRATTERGGTGAGATRSITVESVGVGATMWSLLVATR